MENHYWSDCWEIVCISRRREGNSIIAAFSKTRQVDWARWREKRSRKWAVQPGAQSVKALCMYIWCRKSAVRYKFKLIFWFDVNVHWGNWVSVFGGFQGCSISSGNCKLSYALGSLVHLCMGSCDSCMVSCMHGVLLFMYFIIYVYWAWDPAIHVWYHVCILGISCMYLGHIMYVYWAYHATHRGDHTSNIWISRYAGFPGHSFEWRRLRFLTWNPVWIFGDLRENVFHMYGDSRENLLEISAVVIISSPISSVCGIYGIHGWRRSDSKLITTAEIPNKFSREFPYISNTFSRESPKFQTGSTWVNGVPVTQKISGETGKIWRSKRFKSDLLCERHVCNLGIHIWYPVIQDIGRCDALPNGAMSSVIWLLMGCRVVGCKNSLRVLREDNGVWYNI